MTTEFLTQLLIEAEKEQGSLKASNLWRSFPSKYLTDDLLANELWNICNYQHSEYFAAGIYLPDISKINDISNVIGKLWEEHYRPRIYSNVPPLYWGDYGIYEVWPLSEINAEEFEVCFYLPEDKDNILNIEAFYFVELTNDLIEHPEKIRDIIFPKDDLVKLAAYYDRQFLKRKQDFFLDEKVRRVKWLLKEVRQLQPKVICEAGIWGADLAWQWPQFDFIEKGYLVDLSKESLKHGLQRLNDPRFEGIHNPLEDLNSLTDSTIDCMILAEVLEHCCDIDKSLEETKRVVKDGGVVLITVPSSTDTNMGHIRVFDPNIFLEGEDIKVIEYVSDDPNNEGWLCKWIIHK